jgi:hypothetical protein
VHQEQVKERNPRRNNLASNTCQKDRETGPFIFSG